LTYFDISTWRSQKGPKSRLERDGTIVRERVGTSDFDGSSKSMVKKEKIGKRAKAVRKFISQ